MELRKALIGLLIICAGAFVFAICVRSMNATASTDPNHRPIRRKAAVVKDMPDYARPEKSTHQRIYGQATNINTAALSRSAIDAVEKEPSNSQSQIDEIEIKPGEIRLPQFYRWDEQPAIGEEYTLSVDQ